MTDLTWKKQGEFNRGNINMEAIGEINMEAMKSWTRTGGRGI